MVNAKKRAADKAAKAAQKAARLAATSRRKGGGIGAPAWIALAVAALAVAAFFLMGGGGGSGGAPADASSSSSSAAAGRSLAADTGALPDDWSVRVRVLDSGDSDDGTGVDVTLTASHPLLASHELLRYPGATRVALRDLRDGDVLTAVTRAVGKHYVWPTPYVGHRTIVEDIDPSCKKPATDTGGADPIELEVLAKSPRVLYVHNFLSQEETESLVAFAESDANPYSMQPSTVGPESWTSGGKSSTSTLRTSENAFVTDTAVAKRVKRRAFELLRIRPYREDMADGIQARLASLSARVPCAKRPRFESSWRLILSFFLFLLFSSSSICVAGAAVPPGPGVRRAHGLLPAQAPGGGGRGRGRGESRALQLGQPVWRRQPLRDGARYLYR